MQKDKVKIPILVPIKSRLICATNLLPYCYPEKVNGVTRLAPHVAVATIGTCGLAIVQQRTSSYRSETAASTASAV